MVKDQVTTVLSITLEASVRVKYAYDARTTVLWISDMGYNFVNNQGWNSANLYPTCTAALLTTLL